MKVELKGIFVEEAKVWRSFESPEKKVKELWVWFYRKNFRSLF